ncbi:MAG TPA: DUF4400 domain-containing protein, partial [Usitatibacter sp.]|nr:DUF4400 domain-containing protein [Usitatibacter sp.]
AVPGDEYPAEPTQRGITIVIERLRSLLFLALYRLSAIGEAALPLMLGILAAAIDGLAVRRRRAYSFATTSTAAYNAATYILLSLSMSAFLYLVAPLALPAALLPLAAFGAAGAVWIVFAHLPGAGPLIGLRT